MPFTIYLHNYNINLTQIDYFKKKANNTNYLFLNKRNKTHVFIIIYIFINVNEEGKEEIKKFQKEKKCII